MRATNVRWRALAVVAAVVIGVVVLYATWASPEEPDVPKGKASSDEALPFQPKHVDLQENEIAFQQQAAENAQHARELELAAASQEKANDALLKVNVELDRRREELNKLSGEIVSLQSKRTDLENEVADAQRELKMLEQTKMEQQAEIKRRSLEAEQAEAAAVAAAAAKPKAVAVKRGPPPPAPPPSPIVIDEQSEDYKAKADASFRKHAFNEYKSSLLPLDREIPDVRISQCRSLQWDLSKVPKISIIMCFVNEAWSALLRSVWSVINRSPMQLIAEILLIDDASDADWLGPHLTDYVDENWSQHNVKIIRSEERLGLIRARLLGAKHAVGEIMVFLDSHIECNKDWLPPLVMPIAEDPSAVVTPVIDTIDYHTMEYGRSVVSVPAVGTFSWTMDFTWKNGVIKPGDKPTDPVDSPTMAGGLFAINRKYFYDIGSYDQKMGGWGGENLEMSFRIWQCGGKLVSAPCSHVGHIFRDTHPYTVPGSSIHQTFLENSLRVAEVWMDEYKVHFLNSNPAARKFTPGDVTERKALRERLKCKPFKWYLQTLVPDMFVPDSEHIRFTGMLRNTDGQCLDKMGHRSGGTAGVYFCHGQGSNQAWMYSTNNEIRSPDDLCLDAWASTLPGDVFLHKCHQMKGNQEWKYDETTKVMMHAGTKACLESHIASNGQKQLKINTCSNGAPSQQWTWRDSV